MTERLAYLDCIGGISGDMLLASTIDAGVEQAFLEEVVNGLNIGRVRLQVEKSRSHGIAGSRVQVECEEQHSHRHLSDIEKILDTANLSDEVRRRARGAFARLAEAEARVHGCEVEEIHFHEVGAADAIVDIVGTCAAFEALGVTAVYGSAVPPGSGTVKCAHGVLPLPAPATLELLRGWPLSPDVLPGETVTPTGAALLVTLTLGFRARPGMVAESVGYGLGRREWVDRPNALRLVIGSAAGSVTGAENGNGADETVAVIEAGIDDMNPEFFGRLSPVLLAQGALDVFYTAIQMKKARPGVLLTVLCRPDQTERMAALIFRETTTLGVRVRTERRLCLRRSWMEVGVMGETVRVKLGRTGEEKLWPNLAPEYEDCQRVAEATGRPVKEIYTRAVAAAVQRLERTGGWKTDEE